MTGEPLRRLASVLGALGVLAGAFGAHGLKDQVTPERLAVWETAARYHLLHAILLVGLSLLPSLRPLTARLLLTGILIFSGSLYLLVLTDRGWLGAITPIGGLCLIAGWGSLALGRSPAGNLETS